MGKTLLHRLFGLGKIPKPMAPILQQEGIVLLDEGIGGSVIFRSFRAPGKRYGYRRKWFTGSVVITGQRFAAFIYSKPIINVPMEREWLGKLTCSVEGEDSLRVLFDAGAFNEDWSGSIECRFTTPKARLFLEQLERPS